MGRPTYLLLGAEEPGQVVWVQVIFEVAVGKHEEVQIPAGRHHLVERAELLKAQGSLVFIRICVLQNIHKSLLSDLSAVPVILTLTLTLTLSIRGYCSMFVTRADGDLDQLHIYC